MKRIISCLLVILLMSSMLNISVYAVSDNSDYLSKIDDELLQKMENDKDGIFNVSVWFNDISEEDVNNEINKEIETYIEKNTSASTLAFSDATVVEALQDIGFNRSIRNDAFKKLYSENNSNAVNRVKRNMAVEDEDVIFSSSYTPNVTMKLNVAEIYSLAQDNAVDYIYPATTISNNHFSDSESTETNVTVEACLDALKISHLRDDCNLTGESIKIGLIDRYKVNKYLSPLSNLGNRLVIDPMSYNSGSAHGSKIAAMMVGKFENDGIVEYVGAVPDATLYCTTVVDNVNVSSDSTDEWKERIEWLLDCGVNVINISDSLVDERYTAYNEVSRWIDHIAYQHKVTVVAAVGYSGLTSDGSVNISPLAYCKNIIVVGAVDLNDDTNDSYTYDEYEGSVFSTTGVYYPHVVAPGNIDTIVGFPGYYLTGNSFSAPLVVSLVAQLMQYTPDLINEPTAVRTVIMAGTDKLNSGESSTATDDIDMDRKYGAGVINALHSYQIIYSSTPECVCDTFDYGDVLTSHTYKLNFYAGGGSARIALNWDKSVTIDNDHISGTIDDEANSFLSLKVTSPNGVEYKSFDVSGAFQVLYIDPPNNDLGEYTITIDRYGPSGYELTYGIAVYGNLCYLGI